MTGKLASTATFDAHHEMGARWTVPASTLAAVAVAAAMAASSIVFSEPAVADVLMAAVIAGLPLLGVVRFGRMSLVNLGLWLVFVALGLAACSVSTTFDTAVTHQVVTLFLALGAFVLAVYVTADPEPRFRLVMNFYLFGCLMAAGAALIGYFQIVPALTELFTNYGRARGTFKDPNVLGAALAPAIAFVVWVALRQPWRHVLVAGAVGLPLVLALFLSFSRGAWASAVVSVLLVVWLSLVTTRRTADVRRFVVVSVLGSLALVAIIASALELEAVEGLFEQRASLDQSYDEGPEGRFGGQAKAIGLILDHPLGIGTHTFRDTYHPEEAHNVYLSQFMNAGWIGGMLYAISVFATLAAGLYAIRRRTALQGPLIVATAALAGLAFEGFVIDTDHWRHFFVFMGLIWGLVDAGTIESATGRRSHD
ncbi:MAG: O-antigen ligase family protein [Hyphomicrobium sp.]|uniref:O-antigen ligase family protein n=1 Tax=Hyphomicrobium sp. TaxID=82 RepID=UPI003D0F0C39